jgi:hypothetical protein
MFVLDQNHSELTERHTRKRFRPRGGLSKRSDVDASLKRLPVAAAARTPPPTFLFPSQPVKEQRNRERQNPTGRPVVCSGCSRKHGTDRLGHVPNEPDLGSPASLVNTGTTCFRSGPNPTARRALQRKRLSIPTEVGLISPAFPMMRLAPSRVSGGVNRRLIGPSALPCQRPRTFCFRRSMRERSERLGGAAASVPPHCRAKQALPRPFPARNDTADRVQAFSKRVRPRRDSQAGPPPAAA